MMNKVTDLKELSAPLWTKLILESHLKYYKAWYSLPDPRVEVASKVACLGCQLGCQIHQECPLKELPRVLYWKLLEMREYLKCLCLNQI